MIKTTYKNRWVPVFLEFLKLVKVPSKDMEVPGPITPYDAQLILLAELDEGLSQDQHFFVCLKARQLGASTILLALDIFWLFMFPGLQGALIADTDANREIFRETITMMLDSLPAGWRVPVTRHNRNALTLENGSRLQYMSAGTGKNKGLGRSRGLNFVHASEVSSYGDQIGIDSLAAALSEVNPNRLYIFESTALGYNVFFDLHSAAKKDSKKRALFIGWWAKSTYRIKRDDPDFAVWWGMRPHLNDLEQVIFDLVKTDYGHELDEEQWAWWRKKADGASSEASLLSEFPYHEKVAFQATGFPFFNLKKVNEDMDLVRTGATFDVFHYDLGDDFRLMKCLQVPDISMGELRVWERPVKNAKYVIGIDVAYGRSETNDRHCIQVFRCYADKLVQVAEYATPIPETRTLAWVLAHLAGSYRDCVLNLETNGPGQQVMDEMRFLRQQISSAHLRNFESTFRAEHALDQARWYLYHRPEQPGAGYLYGWKTNASSKLHMYNAFRDAYNTNQILMRSVPLLDEMLTLVQNGASIGGSSGKKDDRPFAAGLANHAWTQWVRPEMMKANRTWEREQAQQQQIEDSGTSVNTSIIPQFFIQASKERKAQEMQQLLGGINRYR